MSLEIAADIRDGKLFVESNLSASARLEAAVYVLVKPGTSPGLIIAALHAVIGGLEKDEIRDRMAAGRVQWSVPAELVAACEPRSERGRGGDRDRTESKDEGRGP